jgi:hypothetical protein
MNATEKKVLKKIFQYIEKSKKCMKKLNKSIKNKPGLKKCEQFCKNDYVVEINRLEEKDAKKYNFPYRPPTKKTDFIKYKNCKQVFCNEKCDCYYPSIYNKTQKDFKKNIKNGFQKTYSKKKVDVLKKKGALSGCVEELNYDVFHK